MRNRSWWSRWRGSGSTRTRCPSGAEATLELRRRDDVGRIDGSRAAPRRARRVLSPAGDGGPGRVLRAPHSRAEAPAQQTSDSGRALRCAGALAELMLLDGSIDLQLQAALALGEFTDVTGVVTALGFLAVE